MTIRQHRPAEMLSVLTAADIAVLRSRHPELSPALDVAPPAVIDADARGRRHAFTIAALHPSVYQYARRAYRFLNQFGPLRPFLARMHSSIKGSTDHPPAALRKDTESPPLELRSPASLRRLTLPGVSRSYTIAFTMRSGSNEICNLLARNGLGAPNEFFQNPLRPDPGGLLLNSFGRIVSRFQAEGVFGSKMSHDHRAALDEQLRAAVPEYRRLDDVLPSHRWVWLKRQDKILQAISWCRAEASNEWATAGVDNSGRRDYSYDFFHILSRAMLIYTNELSWEAYFREQKLHPFVITYEDFFGNLDGQLPALIEYLGGLPHGRRSIDKSITYAMQRDTSSYAVRDRFVSDLCRLGEKSIVPELGEPLQRWMQFFFQYGWRG